MDWCQHTLHLISRRGATRKSARALSTKRTQVTSYFPPNARSCTVSWASRTPLSPGVIQSAATSGRTSSLPSTSQRFRTSLGRSVTYPSHPEYMRKYVASSKSSSTQGSTNPPTLPTVRAGSASSRRTENHSVSSIALNRSTASPLNTLGLPPSQIRLANTSPGALARCPCNKIIM